MTNKLRILHIVGDPVGGIRKHVHDVLNGLSGDFDFFYISSKKGDAVYRAEICSIEEKITAHELLDITKRPSLKDVKNIFKVIQFIRKHQIDLVHGHGAKGGLYARVAGKLAGCKVVYTPHGGVVHNMFKPIEARVYTSVEKILCHFTDLIIFESNYTAKAFKLKFGCKRVDKIVNYNGVESPVVFVDERKDVRFSPKKLGVFAMLREEKGQHLALKAVSELLSEGESLELHFFGEGDLRMRLEQKVYTLNIANKVFFHGEVSHVYQYMKDMDFVLIPSLFESFGYVAVEAMMLRVPVISSDAGGLKEVVSPNTGFIFSSGDVLSARNAIMKALISSDSKLLSMTENAQKVVEGRFSLHLMLNRLKDLYLGLG